MRKKLKDIADIKFCLSSASKNENEQKAEWITPANLLENNVIANLSLSNQYKIDDNAKISPNDIIVKRINPSFVNYVDAIKSNVYASGNLIVIKSNAVDAKYLAYFLNKKINQITKSFVGSTIPAIGRNDLEEISIPILSLNQQKAVGEIWYCNTNLQKLKKHLAELERIKVIYFLDTYIKTEIGEVNNDR